VRASPERAEPRDALRVLAHSRLTFNAPLSDERAAAIVGNLALAPGRHALDLGCGWGELLLRVVASHPASTGTGVDVDRIALDRARRAAAARGLQQRVEFVEDDATSFEDRGHLVLCVGSSHAWGGATPALRALRERVELGGSVLFADGFWERPPGSEARRIFGELPVFDGLLSVARAAGFSVESADRSSREEWDAFEAGWRAALECADDADARLLALAREREYRDGYRGILGFAWLVLSR
jgi:cyclopropane fatty-acyl-phospholipid synthase-like methyltransferase